MRPTVQLPIPGPTLRRLKAGGIDLSEGYPAEVPLDYLQDYGSNPCNQVHDFVDAGTRADPEKKALFGAAKQVIHLTNHIGTEIVGLQLKDLTDKQKDELALLIAERGVVFFRDQDLSPQAAETLGAYWGKLYPQGAHIPGLPNSAVIWTDYLAETVRKPTRQRPFQGWHTDMVHGLHTPGITHLHQDAVPEYGGDLTWASGYAAYSKLSPDFRKIIDGKKAVFKSMINFLDRDDPNGGQKTIETIHPIVRVHPATGWKSLFVNRDFIVKIVGLDQPESDLLVNYLCNVYERNPDIQVRFKWTPGSSALFDNRVTLHTASWDYENKGERHGIKVTTLGEAPYFDEKAITRRAALGLDDD